MSLLRPILLVLAILLTTLGIAMLIPLAVDLWSGHDNWQVFAVSAGISLFIGGGLWITHVSRRRLELSLQQAFLLTTLSWLVMSLFAAIPLALAELSLSPADAFFEAMSGLTTTGSTVIANLESASPGILMWRALLQWLGGVGIIVMAIAVLPMLQVGGMQLFHLESSDKQGKILPRARQLVGNIIVLYGIISTACVMAYWTAGMSVFEAICHAMTTVATGGFSTRNESLGGFDSALIDWIAVTFMIAGSLPFTLFLLASRGNVRPFLKDPQVRLFFAIVISLVAAMTIYQMLQQNTEGGLALRYAAFNIVSILTGTGYATTDYTLWGGLAETVFFLTMFIGGCAGSTSCGVKIFRIHVLFVSMQSVVRGLFTPSGVFVPRYGGQPIQNSVIASVTSFAFLFTLIFGILSLLLSMHGLDLITSVSAAGTALANVGPGLGPIVGPTGNFAPLPDSAKVLLALGMLLGRLELFTVLVLFSRSFWR